MLSLYILKNKKAKRKKKIEKKKKKGKKTAKKKKGKKISYFPRNVSVRHLRIQNKCRQCRTNFTGFRVCHILIVGCRIQKNSALE